MTVHETPILASTSNRVTQVQDASATVKRTLTYSPGGALTQDALTAGATYNYGYDARKRLVSAGAVSGDQGTYGYDYQGRRVWRTVTGSTATIQTHYVFDEAGHLLAEHDGATGAVLREYVWLDDMPVAMIDSTGTSPATYFIHTGQIEEPLVMTDSGQTKVWDAYVEPFGSATVFGTPSAGLDLRLPGQFTQAETGALSQNWNRDYDTSLGRYIEADPLGIDAGQNVYGYVDGDPLDALDDQGLYPAVVVYFPGNSTPYVPTTKIKNSAQAAAFGRKIGTQVPIPVPPWISPQAQVELWCEKNHRRRDWIGFKKYWNDKNNNYKTVSSLFDAYGNFAYGATGAANGFPDFVLQAAADYKHDGSNNPINSADIASGANAVHGGGRLGVVDITPPPGH